MIKNKIVLKNAMAVLIFLTGLLISNISYAEHNPVKNTDSSENKVTNSMTQSHIFDIMKQVANWQISNQDNRFHDLDWTNATFYIGLMDFALLSNDGEYFKWLKNVGTEYKWQPYYQMYIADDIAVSQMYLDMYQIDGDKKMFNPTQARTEWIVNHPSTSSMLYGQGLESYDRWSWCDALFMAPPVYVQMYNITQDNSFLDFMDKEYHATYDLLYDQEENLFYRDYRYKTQREKNGEKIFWGRGNGWVMGGLVKILKELPQTSLYYGFYKKLFSDMCLRVSKLQDKDGYWHASLLDPVAYPNPETSGSGFFIYALAYGINSGILDKETYLPIVERGWKALEQAVYPDGKLGWIQPIGASPEEVTKDMTEVYGVGAFLLAGCEVYKLCDGN